MESGTPYNSVYELIGGGKRSNRSSNEEEQLVCCAHGAKCGISHKETDVVVDFDKKDEEEGLYVNLIDPPKKGRDDKLNSVRKQLQNLEVGKDPRQKKMHKQETNRLVKKDDLEENGTIPPYNSIYEMVNCGNRKKSAEGEKVVACCAHGGKCCESEQEDQPEENRDDLLNLMKTQLMGLNIGKNPRLKKKEKKKEMSRSEEVEDEVFPRKPIRVVQPQIESKNNDSSQKKRKGYDSGNRLVFKGTSKTQKEMEQLLGESSDLLWETYIGAMVFEDAEQAVKTKTDFRLYHRLESPFSVDDLEVHSSLHFVYHSIYGYYRHYPICKRTVGGERHFYVEYGNPRVEGHPTLEQLIRFYKNSSGMNKLSTDIGRDQ